MLHINPILATDSYKLSHAAVYPQDTCGMFAYIEARTNGKHVIVPFGLQMWLKKLASTPVTKQHIAEAVVFAKAHGEPFDPKPWEYMVERYNGVWPIHIKAVPEGTPVASGNVIVTIECTDSQLFWLPSYLETAIQRAVWYPTTIASMDYEIKREIANFYRISGADTSLLPFSLHDFGARGVTCGEQAEIGGAAHLVNFLGSDNIEGIRAANYYYSDPMAGFSVPATEHSVECSFGGSLEEETEYLKTVLDTYAKPGAIVSIVIDGYDVFRAAEILCTRFKDKIITSGAKVVFRPDSGDMMEVVPRILRLQAAAFGVTKTSTGYAKINNVGIIQGDGVDHMSIKTLLGNILAMGYSADNVIFGSGGALLQTVNRDTYKFAQKASAILVDGAIPYWKGIAKSPVTDPGKKSKSGRVTLYRSLVDGSYLTANAGPTSNEFVEVLKTVYSYGHLVNMDTLSNIRARCVI